MRTAALRGVEVDLVIPDRSDMGCPRQSSTTEIEGRRASWKRAGS